LSTNLSIKHAISDNEYYQFFEYNTFFSFSEENRNQEDKNVEYPLHCEQRKFNT